MARPDPCLELRVGVLSDGGPPGPVHDHVSATLVAGVTSTRASRAALLEDVDVLWVDAGLDERDGLGDAVERATGRGAVVIATDRPLLGSAGPRLTLGGATFPPVRPALRPLQKLIAALLDAFPGDEASLLFADRELPTARGTAGEIVVAANGGALCALTRRERGEVLWLGVLGSSHGAGFRPATHRPQSATVWQLIVDEVLSYAFERKHGVVVRKLFGPYGLAMLAWQAHVEEIGALGNHALERFVERLARSRQVPTFSLIRRMITWGHRAPGLVELGPWAGPGSPLRAQPDGPATFSGRWLRLADGGAPPFPPDPRYVEYYTPFDDQPRLYPAPLPDGGLLIGTPGGLVERYRLIPRDGRLALEPQGPLRLVDGTPIRAGGAAAPTIASGPDGRLRLVIAGDGDTLLTFTDSGGGWVPGPTLEIGERVSPRLVDWSGSGDLDLMVGTERGAVVVFADVERNGLGRPRTLFTLPGRRRIAPFPLPDAPAVLFGDAAGTFGVWQAGAVTELATQDCAITGAHHVFVQQDAVPVVVQIEGARVLVAAAAVVNAPHAIDRPATPEFRALAPVLAALRHAHVPVNAHVFLLPRMAVEDVTEELARHRQCFASLHLPWEGAGANQHFWIVPDDDRARVLLQQAASGLRYNFGWQSPERDPVLWYPFQLDSPSAFVLCGPLVAGRHARALELMTSRGLPSIVFIHPDHRVDGEPARELDGFIGEVEAVRGRHRCVFVTETQMARSIVTTLATTVAVSRDEAGVLHLEADASAVPAWAAGYRDTLAVRIRCRETGGTASWESDAAVFDHRDGDLVTVVAPKAAVGPPAPGGRRWRVAGANGPIEVSGEGVRFAEPGYQELHLAGDALALDWPGAHVRRTAEGLVATRFGAAGTARISAAGAIVPATVEWSAHPSQQDRWVMEAVFPGRRTPGFFVETGAADGVSSSATLALERAFGWRGIAVEPNRRFFEQLRRNRRCAVDDACVAERSGTVEFIEASWFGRIREHARAELPDGDHRGNPFLVADIDGAPARIVAKKARSLEALLRAHRAPRRIDFMSIDAEGSEWHILAPFPFERWEVLALCVHSKFWWDGRLVDTGRAEPIRRLLVDHGYFYDRERSRTAEHDFFLHPGLVSPPWGVPSVLARTGTTVRRGARAWLGRFSGWRRRSA